MPLRRNAGLTLIEMLIALAILSLVSLAATTALRSFAQSQVAVERKIEKAEQMRMTLAFVRRSLQKTVPIMHPKGFYTYFKGTADELIWVAPMSQVGAKGLQILRLSVGQDGEMLLQMLPYNSDWKPPVWADVEAYKILAGGAELELGYRANWQERWQDAWDLSTESPSTVRVNIRMHDEYWPELIVHMAATQAVQL
ncbi:prepilin-type N-terminal cleavage/methylation domain-containing protein [uncultured Pseudoteredinibacter sp.]|uniref:prepilin-type N-terminal cleavage/methylation domain-containing protein n=1 Tax=uncultured Pseudoteredinibacter sp. TaxID=1641701 RepID=UPI0026253543|nr:prepilin-type N-terminal cleavage/methylation domain-containing protein [uncultured Pseudoteredinibacter sp.]